MTEYEEMLVAAGWIKAEDLDEDYQRFVKESPVDREFKDYAGYLYLKTEWAQLNEQYEREIAPEWQRSAATGEQPSRVIRDRDARLLKEMDRIEYALGY